MDKLKYKEFDKETEFEFTTEAEALAFKKGVEYVNDSMVFIKSIEGDGSCWIVYLCEIEG